jgi:hypothetical protein
MLTGRVPYEGTTVQKMWGHANVPAPSAREVNPRVPPELDAVVARAMAKDPDARFPSAGDLGRAAQAAASGHPTQLAERSVAQGAAASGAADSIVPRHLEEPTRLVPETPTERLAPASRRGWRRAAIPLLALLVVAGAGAAVLASSGGDDSADESARNAGSTATAAKAKERPAPTETTTTQEPTTSSEPPDEGPAPARPARYDSYTPATFGYSAELPAGPGWSKPAESEPTPNRLYRTTVRGPNGYVLIIDYTPNEPAAFGGDYDAKRVLEHPFFGSMTEYVFSGGKIPQCAGSPCLDYIVNDQDGGFGYGVLGGGTDDSGLTRDVTRHVAESLTYKG